MKKALLPTILSLILVLSATAHAQDVPPRGASFFDSMLNTLGIDYDGRPLPETSHPLEDLLKKLNQHSTFFTSVIPFGRSLQKMAAYPNSPRYPRVLIATSEVSRSLNTHFRGRLFIGYVEAAKKLEVISFNPMMGRYEFQFVDNFQPGGKAQIRYVPRSLCLRCHQGGTPIFAGGEWLETTAFNPELRKLSEAAIGSKEYLGISLTRDDPSSKYEALPRPESFEDMVRFGALLVGYQKAWQKMCSTIDCKKKLIKWMLVTNLFDKIALELDPQLLRRFVAVLGDGTIDVPSEKLLDHNPMAKGQLSYEMPPELDPSLPREPMQIAMASRNDPVGLQFYKFYIFVQSMGKNLFTEKDFVHIRSLLDGETPGADRVCLADPAARLQQASSPEKCFPKKLWMRFTQAIDGMALTRDDPLSREVILQKLDKGLGTAYAAGLCCQKNLDPQRIKAPENKALLAPASIKDRRLQAFVKFCSECHLYQDLPPPFLAGGDEAEVLLNIKNKAELIQFRLENKQMPPHFARLLPSAKEREDLLQDLQKIKGKSPANGLSSPPR